MSTYEQNMKSGHPVLGIVLGVVGIAVALLTTLATGVIGGGVAAILGVVAILLGVNARKSGRGVGAIILGIIAVILAIVMITTTITAFNTIRQKAEEAGDAPLVARYVDKPYLGILGMVLGVPKDEATQKEFTDQLNLIVNRYGNDANLVQLVQPANP